ncbi:MAG: acyl-CoA carboxylase subunit beta [Deltaproteobacteria bacterium]|nr:acyl-CoA carboxylase subunit beta [Deltaproteobacteria bacterium]
MKTGDDVRSRLERIRKGGEPKYHAKASEEGKLFCRERLALLLDPDSFVEDAAFANSLAGDLPADGVVTGSGRVAGRPVCVMANDSTVKAGSWGWRTVEKILRIQETAERLAVPLLYLVDSAGARITDQIQMFPGRRGAGRIFANQCRMSGYVPQLCLLFGPSAAGGAYIPAFCDVLFMVEGNASMYLGSPRMAEMVIGQQTTLEEMGGARMHCSVSGLGDWLAKDEREAIAAARACLAYLPLRAGDPAPRAEARPPAKDPAGIEAAIPRDENKPFDVREVIDRLVDADSWFELKRLWAGELLTGFARIDGRAVGVLANQSKVKGGVLFVDSADKAARFIGLCDAYGLPLLYLADVPGFMIGKQVERQGIIRAGAKMVQAVSEASVPRISVVLRKAYGAGLYAMSGPGFAPDVCLALPTAMIAVMGPEAAVNAVYYNKLQAMPEGERAAAVEKLRAEYREDIDVERLASELVIDAIVAPEALRDELVARLAGIAGRPRDPALPKRRAIVPM